MDDPQQTPPQPPSHASDPPTSSAAQEPGAVSGSRSARVSPAAGAEILSALLRRARGAIRSRQYSPNTERSYLGWIRRFFFYNAQAHPEHLGVSEVRGFLSHLATQGNVSAATGDDNELRLDRCDRLEAGLASSSYGANGAIATLTLIRPLPILPATSSRVAARAPRSSEKAKGARSWSVTVGRAASSSSR